MVTEGPDSFPICGSCYKFFSRVLFHTAAHHADVPHERLGRPFERLTEGGERMNRINQIINSQSVLDCQCGLSNQITSSRANHVNPNNGICPVVAYYLKQSPRIADRPGFREIFPFHRPAGTGTVFFHILPFGNADATSGSVKTTCGTWR